jgi:dihydroflavonol-4-reductase
MTALVTGGTGFVGSAVVRALLAAGEPVRALVRPSSDTRNLDGLPVERVTGDLRDASSLHRALAGCATLYHVAADYRLWAPDPRELYASNVEGTRALMEAALAQGVGRIVYTSSVATLGLHADGWPADEETPVGIDDMIGHYKRSKYLAEEVVRAMARTQGLPAVIVNPSAPVGPRDRKPTPTGRMVLDAAAGRMPAYVDTGLNIVHVDDVAAGHLAACRAGRIGERYILGSENMSLREILAAISGIVGRPPPRLRLPHGLLVPVAHVAEAWARRSGREPLLTVDGVRLARKHMYFTCERARRELGYAPRPAHDALADAVAGFRALGYL